MNSSYDSRSDEFDVYVDVENAGIVAKVGGGVSLDVGCSALAEKSGDGRKSSLDETLFWSE